MTVNTDGPQLVAPCYQPLVSVLVPSYQAGPYLALLVETEVGAFYWTVLAPEIVNSRREERGSVSV